MNYNSRIRKMEQRNKKSGFSQEARTVAGQFLVCAMFSLAVVVGGIEGTPVESVAQAEAIQPEVTAVFNVEQEIAYKTVQARVTGYNTVPEQTDATPCLAASGHNICGRSDVVACPRYIQLGTKVEIDGKIYTCLDRTAKKYGNRFDISCDKDKKCPALVTGNKEVKIFAK